MRTTFFFATIRLVQGDGTSAGHYSDFAADHISYAVAMVDGTDLQSLNSGKIVDIGQVTRDDFSDAVAGDLSGGRNLLSFLHGFANSFADGITRAAFNREFLAASGVQAADCSKLIDTGPGHGIDTSHPFYRRLAEVRDDMAKVMAGGGKQDRTVL